MPRITTVKSARKPQGRCEKCQKEIGVGDSYKWCAPRSHRASKGTKRKRCVECPSWRPSELTSSQHLATIYGAQEDFESFVRLWAPGEGDSGDDLADALRTAAETIREAAESYRESAQAIEDGFGHSTYVSDELNDKAEQVDSWADDIEQQADDLPDQDEYPLDDDEETPEEERDGIDVQAWQDACVEVAESIMGECPV